MQVNGCRCACARGSSPSHLSLPCYLLLLENSPFSCNRFRLGLHLITSLLQGMTNEIMEGYSNPNFNVDDPNRARTDEANELKSTWVILYELMRLEKCGPTLFHSHESTRISLKHLCFTSFMAIESRLLNDVFSKDNEGKVPMDKVMILIWLFRDDPSVVQFMAHFVAKVSDDLYTRSL